VTDLVDGVDDVAAAVDYVDDVAVVDHVAKDLLRDAAAAAADADMPADVVVADADADVVVDGIVGKILSSVITTKMTPIHSLMYSLQEKMTLLLLLQQQLMLVNELAPTTFPSALEQTLFLLHPYHVLINQKLLIEPFLQRLLIQLASFSTFLPLRKQ